MKKLLILRSFKIAAVIILAAAIFAVLLTVHNSAQSLIQQASANTSYDNAINAVPLATLNDVVVNTREHGHNVIRVSANQMFLGRDTRTITVNNASGALPFHIDPGHVENIDFTSGQATYDTGLFGAKSELVYLSNGLTANFSTKSGPVHIFADGMRWQASNMTATATGSIKATLGKLGSATCQSMSIDIAKRLIDFGPVEVIASDAVLQTSAATSTAPATSAQDNNIVFKDDEGGHWDAQTNIFHVTGPVTVTQGKVSLKTVGVDYDDNTKIAHALSAVLITDDQNTLHGDNGDVNFKSHVATVTGHVDIFAIPQAGKTAKSSDVDTEAKKPTHLHCDTILYNYRTKLADASGHLTVLQTTRTVTADTGHYDTTAEIITLNGNVDGKSTDGKHLQAPEAVVSVNPDDEWMEIKGPVKYSFTVSDDDNPLPTGVKAKLTPSTNSTATAPVPSPSPTPNPVATPSP